MVRHIIIWEFKEGFSDAENRSNAEKIKMGLEGLKGRIKGLLEIKVVIDILPSSTANIVLGSEFDSKESLKAYQVNPEHVKVATFVRSVTQNRQCVDFEDKC